ncbi:MAG: hypothetical protein J6S04_01480 [Clostridia bacterium]|nr:hypothetical protein [Clostridia bacterium]
METNAMQKNTAFRRVKYLTLMQIGDSVRDLRTGSKAKLAAKIAIKTLLAMVMMAVFVLVFGVMDTVFQLPPSRNMLITLLFVTQIVSIISCLSSMMLTLFASKENTMLLAFPCNYSEIFLSKIIVFSLEELRKNLYFILPLLVGFGINGGVGVGFWLQLPVMWGILSLIPVFIGAMLSIPAIFIKRFMQNHVWVYAILMIILFGAAFFGIYSYLSQFTDKTMNLLVIYGEFIEGVKESFVTVNKFALFYNWIGKSLYGEMVWLYLPLILVVLAGLCVLCFLAAMPFYFKATSASNENSTTKQHQLTMSNKGGLFGTFFRKELKIQLRSFQSVNSILIVVFVFPLITYVFNFLMGKINTSSMGGYMSIAFNMMIILSLLGTHNANSAASISMEGNEFAVLKTAPSNTSVIAWAKLAVTGLVNLASLCMMACMTLMTTPLPLMDVVMLMVCILCVSLGQIAWGFEFDIRKPKITEYATKGDGVTDNGNIAKAMAVSFLVSTLFGIVGLLFMAENYMFGWVRLVALSVGFLLARFYLLHSNLKAYFEDIQG